MTTTDDATDLPTCWEVQPQHGLCTNLQATPTPDEMNENTRGAQDMYLKEFSNPKVYAKQS